MVRLKCVICGATFEWARRGRQPQTCGSDECRRKRRAQSVREHRWRKRGGQTVQTRICLNCEGPFEFVRIEGVRGQGPGFCSEKCRRQGSARNARDGQQRFRAGLGPEERQRRRRVALLARYGLTPDGYQELLEAQGGVCAICGQPETKHHSPLLKIDHDRSCCSGSRSCGGCVRGLLCSNCNRALGLLADDPGRLQAALRYLG